MSRMFKELSVFLFLIMMSFSSYTQIVSIGCQAYTDATVGLDRKDWANGSTANHSEGYMMNFIIPSNTFGPCKKISEIKITYTINNLDLSAMPADCNIGAYWTNLYLGCSSFAPASCPTSNILDEFPNNTPTSQVLTYTCPPENINFGDVLGVDLIPAATTGCTNGQAMISSGQVVIDYDVCVEMTVIDDVIDVPVNLGGNINICPNDTELIDAGAGYDMYNWLPNGQMTQSITEGVGVYTVTVTDSNGCTSTDDIELIPIPLDVMVTSDDADNIVCAPDMVTLTANTSGTMFLWSNGLTTSSITVGAGTYTVTVTDANGCVVNSDADPITIVVNTPPNAGTNNNITVCNDGLSFDLFGALGSADTGGMWIDVDGTMVNLSDDQNVSFLNVPEGNYDFSYTVLGTAPCTDAMATVTVNVKDAPNAGMNNSLTVCNDSQTHDLFGLLGGADTGGMWVDEDGANVNLSDAQNVSFLNVLVGNYSFSYTVTGSAPCVDDVAVVTVTVEESPNAGTNNAIDVCNDLQTYDLDVLLGMHQPGTWTDDDLSGVNVNINATATSFVGVPIGVYNFTHTVGGSGACGSAQAVIQVTVFNAPNAGLSTSTVVCNDGSTVDLDGLIGPHDATNGSWSDDNMTMVDLSNTSSVSFLNIPVGVYDFTYTVLGVGVCGDAMSTVQVIVEASANAGADNAVSICEGTMYDLNLALTVGTATSGSWADDDSSGALSGNVFNTAGLAGQTFDFTYSLGAGFCGTDEATISVEVVTSLSAGVSNLNNTFCYTPQDSLNLYDFLPGADIGGMFIDLDGSGALQGNLVIGSFLTDGTYQFEYSVGDGVVCPIETSIVEIAFFEEPNFTIQGGASFCGASCVDMDLQFSGNPVYVYSFDVYNEDDDISDLYFNMTMESSLIITVCNDGGNGTISGDTLHIGDSFDSWYLFPSAIGDLNCSIDLQGVSDTIFFDIADSFMEEISPTLCSGDSIIVNNVVYDFNNQTGVETIVTPGECDSIFTINLSFHAPADSLLDLTLCEGDSVLVNGVWYSESMMSGVETIFGGSQNLCDSVVTIDLDFVQEFESFPNETICLGDSIFLEGAWQNTEGVYIDNLISAQGCDSIITTTLSIDPCMSGVDIFISNNQCVGDSEGEISISIDGGVVPFTVDWSGNGMSGSFVIPAINTPGFITGLPAGVYMITITDGNNMITQMLPLTVLDENPPLELEIQVLSQILCFDEINGVLNAVADGGGGDHTYDWDPILSDDPMQSNLGPGLYELTVTDQHDCSITASETLVAPSEIIFNFNTMDIGCMSLNGGTLDVDFIDGGVGPYQVFVDGMMVDPTMQIANLLDGDHIFLVLDANGCEQDSMFTINSDQAINVTVDVQNIPCDGSSGGIFEIINIDGGQGPYEVFVDGVLISPSLMVDDLLVGEHNYLVVDSDDCQVGSTFMIGDENMVSFDVNVEGIECGAAVGGSIEIVNITGVLMPIEVFIDGVSFGTSTTISDLTPGFHTVSVVDANDCASATSAIIDTDVPIDFELAIGNIACDDVNGGSVELLNLSGGTAPINAFLNGDLFDLSMPQIGLDADTYTILLIDANGCEKDTMFTISENQGLSYDLVVENASCVEAMNGSISVLNIMGGSGMYQIEINGQVINEPFEDTMLASGNYELIVSDTDGCSSSESIILEADSSPVLIDYILSYTINQGDSLTLEGTAINSVDSIEWIGNGTLSCTNCLNPISTPTVSTQYQITVWDENACSESLMIDVEVIAIPDFELYVPNVISPNQDGMNDTFDLLSGTGSDIIIQTYQIYDRWGNLIHEQFVEIGSGNGWDGRIDNDMALPGVYVYLIQYSNGPDGDLQTIHGDLTLAR